MLILMTISDNIFFNFFNSVSHYLLIIKFSCRQTKKLIRVLYKYNYVSILSNKITQQFQELKFEHCIIKGNVYMKEDEHTFEYPLGEINIADNEHIIESIDLESIVFSHCNLVSVIIKYSNFYSSSFLDVLTILSEHKNIKRLGIIACYLIHEQVNILLNHATLTSLDISYNHDFKIIPCGILLEKLSLDNMI